MNKFIILGCVIALITACSDRRNKYYDNNNIKEEYSELDSGKSYLKIYYENGIVEEEGMVNEKCQPIGLWKGYYEDGKINWTGTFQDTVKSPYFTFDTVGLYFSRFKTLEEVIYYDDSDVVKNRNVMKNDSVLFYVSYFKNGKEESRGELLYMKNLPVGRWKEYYSDGVLKWEGYYDRGLRRPYFGWDSLQKLKKLEMSFQFGDLSWPLKIGVKYKFRILSEKLSSDFYRPIVVGAGNTIEENDENPELYPYVLIFGGQNFEEIKGRRFLLLFLMCPEEDRTLKGSNESAVFLPVDNESDMDYFRKLDLHVDIKGNQISYMYLHSCPQ